jgi:hypothetical protein
MTVQDIVDVARHHACWQKLVLSRTSEDRTSLGRVLHDSYHVSLGRISFCMSALMGCLLTIYP